MKTLDLDTFAKTLTEKGYDGYFLTDGGYPDKLKDSISRFWKLVKTVRTNHFKPTAFC